MPTSRLRIWCDLSFEPEAMNLFEQGIAGHELIHVPRRDRIYPPGGSPDERLADADVCFGRADPSRVMALENIRWVQVPSAGYGAYDRHEVREALRERGTTVTNNSAVFDEPCAEHALALLLAVNRRIPQAMSNQLADHHWDTEGYVQEPPRLLVGQILVILGFGAIARRLVELVAPFKMKVIGVRRTPKGNEPVDVVAQTRVDEVLPSADHVMNILPHNAQTVGFVSRQRIERMKRGAIFYNIGRGKTVDQAALIEALESGHLAAAYLDVTDPEPLPPDHPLWTAPRCYITPHVAGVHAGEPVRSVRHFLDNLRRFENGQPMVSRVI